MGKHIEHTHCKTKNMIFHKNKTGTWNDSPLGKTEGAAESFISTPVALFAVVVALAAIVTIRECLVAPYSVFT